jgi:hypothetical protein
VQPKETAIAKQQLGKHISLAMDTTVGSSNFYAVHARLYKESPERELWTVTASERPVENQL